MPRYDAHRGYAAPAHDRPRLMNLMLPWAAGIVVTLVTQLALAVLVWDVITGDDVSATASPVRTVLLLHLPSAACVALGVWAAAAVHQGASRESRVRHLIAAFTPAVLLQMVIFLSQGSDLTVITFLVQLVVLVVGCAVGYLVDRLRNGEKVSMDTSLVITGVVALAALRSVGRTAQRLRGARSGVSAPARCVRVDEHDSATGSSGDRRARYVFAFTAQDGQWVEFRNSGTKRFHEGARVTVRYDPADPHRTATLAGSPRAALVEGAVAVLLMGLVLLMFLTDFPENLFS